MTLLIQKFIYINYTKSGVSLNYICQIQILIQQFKTYQEALKNMSTYSESSSEDYNQIVESLLNAQNYKEWEQMPQIIYLTFKALYRHLTSIDEEIAKNSQLFTDFSVQLRKMAMEIEQQSQRKDSRSEKQRKTQQLRKDVSGFEKKKSAKNTNNKINNSLYASNPSFNKFIQSKNHSISNTRRVLQYDQPIIQQSSDIPNKNQALLQQMRSMAQKIFKKQNYVSQNDLSEKLNNLKRQLLYKDEQIKQSVVLERKMNDQIEKISSYFKQRLGLIEKNLISTETKFAKKIRQDSEWLFEFVQNNCLMKNQIRQLNKIFENKSNIIEPYKQLYVLEQSEQKKCSKNKTEINSLTDRNKIVSNKRSISKSKSDKNVKKQKITVKNQHKYEPQNSEMHEFKLKALKDLSECVRSADLKKLFDNFHNQFEKKYQKMHLKLRELQKQMHNYQRVNKTLSDSPQSIKNISRKNSQFCNRETVLRPQKSVSGLETVKSAKLPVNNWGKKQNKYYDKSISIEKQQEKSHKNKIIVELSQKINKLESAFVQQSSKKFQENFKIMANELQSKIWTTFAERQQILCQLIEDNVNQVKDKTPQPIVSKINKESSSEITQFMHNTKKALIKLGNQLNIARYLYYGQEQCTDLIHWEKQAHNSMHENFIWKAGRSEITVLASGLYKIEAGLYESIDSIAKVYDDSFDKNTAQNRNQNFKRQRAFLLLNSQPISTFEMLKNVPTIQRQSVTQVHIRARGSIFCEPVLLPAKSKISIRITNNFYGQAYLQIQRL